MNIKTAIDGGRIHGGNLVSPEDCTRLEIAFPSMDISWFVRLISSVPLVGLECSVDAESDQSGIGVELRWMNVDQIIDEATEAYPGIVAVRIGYLPFGICLVGTGDPYFMKVRNNPDETAVVRIPHEALRGDELGESNIETVALSFTEFLRVAELY